MTERLVLAGPIIRRTEPDRVHIWVATSRSTRVLAGIFDLGSAEPVEIGQGNGEAVRLGPNLHVHLIAAVPDEPRFPTDRLLGYDLRFQTDQEELTLDDVGLAGGLSALTYDGIPLPSFFIPSGDTDLRVLHGSCRLLHGRGPDALALADATVGRGARSVQRRPSALFLTGDQIYGDDVTDALIGHLTLLGKHLLGDDDELSLPGVECLSDIAAGGRKDLIQKHAHFTSHAGHNHLISLGEYVATYLVAWNEANWPHEFPDFEAVLPIENRLKRIAARLKFHADVKALEEARATLPRVRRLLANTPTYMIFDDHDVTDDWNMTRDWHDAVKESRLGRRIVANALFAFWAFQGWGNDPEDHTDLTSAIPKALGDRDRLDDLMWSYERWSYVAPTSPRIAVMNTRTRRTYDSDDGGARLVSVAELERTKDLATRSGYEPGDLLVLVSPAPVFALEMAERRQKFLSGKVGPYEVDLESWHDNLCGLMDLMHFLVDDMSAARVVILSGDVHYGMSLDVEFRIRDRSVRFAQLVSSSLKHGGRISKQVLDGLGRILLKDHERLGWERPPTQLRRAGGLRGRLAQRAANTDEWNEDAPVFLSPPMAKSLAISSDPDVHEKRTYIKTNGNRHVRLIGEHNVGLVTITRDTVRQELFCHDDSEMDVYTTEIELARE